MASDTPDGKEVICVIPLDKHISSFSYQMKACCWLAGAQVKSEAEPTDMAGGHRVLIFAQLKGLLDLVQTDIMQQHGISHLRLDGRCALNPELITLSARHATY